MNTVDKIVAFLASLAFIGLCFVAFSNTAHAAAYPVGVGGTGRTTFTSGQLLYGNLTNALSSVATTSVSCTGTTSCSPFTVIGASPFTITGTGSVGSATSTEPLMASWFVATSTTNKSVFPYASSTAFTATSLYATNATLGSATGLAITTSGIFSTIAGTTCTNQFLRAFTVSGGTCATVSLTADVTGILPIANGGTNASSFTTTNNAVYWDATRLVTAGTVQAVTTPYASSTSISASGRIYSADTVNNWSGPLSPTRSLILGTGTTTTWTGTTSLAYVPFAIAPFTGTLRQSRCQATTTQSFLGVTVFINNTKVSPTYFVASTTVGTITFTSNNTFNVGDRISFFAGTTTTDANALGISCTIDTTQT